MRSPLLNLPVETDWRPTSVKPAALALVLLCAAAPQAFAQAPAAATAPAAESFVTRHTGTFNGQKVKYVATVGETVLRDAQGAPTIRFVTTSYVRDGAKDQAARPVIFLFNGGPSSASTWLHMGAFGPRRISPPQDVNAEIPKPYKVVDNAYSLLDVADLVFVDPAETGFTRVQPAAKRADFYQVDGDARSVSGFVEAWLKANGREASPKYVLGESYGTLRAAVMAGQLAKTTPLDGVILMGQAVNMMETSQRPGNAISFATNITALAAVAAYHGRADTGGKTIAAFVDDAYAFGMNEYLAALVKGQDLPAAEREAVARKLQAFTGISADYYLAHDLIISKVDFVSELLKDKGQVVGVYDARYSAPVAAPGARQVDPFGKVMDMVRPSFDAYMTEQLKVTWPMAEYRSFAPETLGWGWSPTSGIGGPFNDFDYQANFGLALKAKPTFRLMIGTGYYDTTTTIGPARYLKARGALPADRVVLHDYEGGHMAYTNEDALKAFSNDVRTFVTGR
jgi:carboxypeptidase C (cathepsin A)